MRKYSIYFTIATILMLLIFTGCAKSEYQTVRLSEVTRSVFYAPQYVALNKGFFEEEGLKIELTSGQGADKVMTAVLSDQVDIGFSGPEAAIYVYNEGKEDYAVVFAQLTKRDGSFLVSRNPEPDFKWSNVRGKTIIGGRKGGVPEMTLEYVLKKNNIIPGKDVYIDTSVQFALMGPAFTGGKGDYVTLFEPVASAVEKEGKGYIVASIGAESGEIPYTAYYAKKSYIEKNKDVIEKFTRAIYKGQKWVDENSPEEIAKAIQPSFPDSDLDILTTVAKRYKEIDAWCKDPIMSKESLELLQRVMKEAGELEKEAKYEDLVTTEFAEKSMGK
ncbi:ABC transporter substrate-binding protein [Acetivibrio clariflavus]|uniref:ABC-type nitrate/sulfonate/bicarbonate transport system, periplasmic component n=1 Tax=Acetivibrio clariflavus (strain DSM 19732 / NBRC 101661 / EBR45) TaxID=720554 RepID=G8M2V6_ACECE|nr:ABC transporter substrate-binding protein [Acetivibrio clariflavus]AEV68220.1 ABC-type nitrate/sulfonate/bicarbonate transport system, periplasmic component [Acetivibrio clariflavus DSM 19732]